MVLGLIAAATLTFTATATGVEKGTPVEFIFAGRNTDRDYETMFLLDDSVDEFCNRLEQAGLPRGIPADAASCRLWPVGCQLKFEPSLSEFIDINVPDGLLESNPVYTGGSRLPNGICDAATNMPASVFSVYALSQSPVVYDEIYDQGSVYGHFTAARKLKKGDRITFTVSWDVQTFPQRIHLTVRPGNSAEILNRLRTASETGEVDALIGFDETLTVAEATAAANALSTVDSSRVKINGCSNIFYRSFLPLVKWRDRSERLVQPFELMLGTTNKLLYIEEDWSVDGPNPKLTTFMIQPSDIVKYPKTDTCFIYADSKMKLSCILAAKKELMGGYIRNWYIIAEE